MNCSRYISELEELERRGMLRSIHQLEAHGKWCKRGEDKLLNLSSNDYLALFEMGDLVDEFISSYKELPRFSSASSRLLTGNCVAAMELEQTIANLFNKESALLFNSGYHANVGIISALTSSQSYIIADKLVHASIIDGIKLSGAEFTRFRHNDIDHLESIIKKVKDSYNQIFIITEGVFSMGGDKGKINQIIELKDRYDNLVVYVDEAHSFGVFGDGGTGVCEEQGVVDKVDIIVGTFGKAISSVGAFAVVPNAVRNYLINKARSLIFSTALPPINIEWSKFIVERLNSFKSRREHLVTISVSLQSGITKLCSESFSQSQIVTLTVGDAARAVELSKDLERRGFYALAVRPPTVAQGCSGIRFSLTSAITQSEINELLNCLYEVS
ncbi:MAG: 8-amino-7-oxononanoate synthase [Rikenellaceae bacterium]